MLYWLKLGEVQTITKAADLLGVHRTTVQRWWKEYKQGGINQLLEQKQRTGRPPCTPSEVIEGIKKQLSQENAVFKSYKEIQQWVKNEYHFDIKYSTLYHFITK